MSCWSRGNSSWVNPAFMKKLIWACLPTTSDTNLEKLHLIHLCLVARALQTRSHAYMYLQTKEWKMGKPKTRDLHVSQTFWCLHEIHWHYVSSSLPDNSRRILPPSLRLAVEKVEVIEKKTSAKPWSAAGRSAVTEEPLTLRPRLSSSPQKTYIPSATSLHTAVWS